MLQDSFNAVIREAVTSALRLPDVTHIRTIDNVILVFRLVPMIDGVRSIEVCCKTMDMSEKAHISTYDMKTLLALSWTFYRLYGIINN